MSNKIGKHIIIILLMLGIHGIVVAQGGRMRVQQRQQHHEQVFDKQENRAAQKPNEGQKPAVGRVQSIKEEFVRKQLDLTPEQNEKFVPLYHQYLQELSNVNRLKRLNGSDIQTNSTDRINKELQYDTEILEIRKRYMGEFLKVMPSDKVNVMINSEHNFNQLLIKELSEKNAATPAPPPAN